MTLEFSNLLSHYENLVLVLDSLTDVIIAHDCERRITFFNRAAERVTGLSRDEVLGRDCQEIFGDGFCGNQCSFCHDDDPNFEIHSYPLMVDDRNGELHQIEATIIPMNGDQGEILGAVLAARDITEISRLRRTLEQERSFQGIVGHHHSMQTVYELIRQVAPTDIPVIVQGESGTGKELVAWAIHNESPRASGAFVAVNCGAIPEGLLESELFGHVRGAFTGAIRDKRGKFERADRGTLFLDEIGELSPAMQVKLLRVLQDKRVERLGAEQSTEVDVRIISATNQNLKQRVETKAFREDLYFRLCVVPIELPPLRERRTDILMLADHFLGRFAQEAKQPVPALSEAAAKRLLDHKWPGNVRELMNALQFAMIKARGNIIEVEDLPPEIRLPLGIVKRKQAGRRQKVSPREVETAMKQAGGNKAQAARLLGVGRSTLYRYLDSLDLE